MRAAGDLGKKLQGYPEYFVNINAQSAVSIIESMINKQWIGNVEYSLTQAQFCPKDNAANINGVLFNVNLDGGRKPCR